MFKLIVIRIFIISINQLIILNLQNTEKNNHYILLHFIANF